MWAIVYFLNMILCVLPKIIYIHISYVIYIIYITYYIIYKTLLWCCFKYSSFHSACYSPKPFRKQTIVWFFLSPTNILLCICTIIFLGTHSFWTWFIFLFWLLYIVLQEHVFHHFLWTIVVNSKNLNCLLIWKLNSHFFI